MDKPISSCRWIHCQCLFYLRIFSFFVCLFVLFLFFFALLFFFMFFNFDFVFVLERVRDKSTENFSGSSWDSNTRPSSEY